MLEIENKKIELKIFKLKLEIEERQTKLKKLEEKLESNNEVLDSIEDEPMGDYIKKLNKSDAELFKAIWKLDPSERLGWKPDGKFKCPMCLQYFKEGFNSYDAHLRFFYTHPSLKHLSTYCIKHVDGSICEQNRYCSYCDDKNLTYGKDNIFNSRTERVRHLKKHTNEGICVPCNVATRDKSEVKAFLKKMGDGRGKQKIPQSRVKPKTESANQKPVIKDEKYYENFDITPPVLREREEKKQKQLEKQRELDLQREVEQDKEREEMIKKINENNKKLGLKPISFGDDSLSEGSETEVGEESETDYSIVSVSSYEDPTEKELDDGYSTSLLTERPTYLT